MTQLGQMIYEDGIQEGIKTGIKTGIETGIKTGIEAGIKTGIETGIKTGIETGIKEGREEGKIEVAKGLLDIMLNEEIAERAKLPLELVNKLRKESQSHLSAEKN